jgi:hypothetical protein
MANMWPAPGITSNAEDVRQKVLNAIEMPTIRILVVNIWTIAMMEETLENQRFSNHPGFAILKSRRFDMLFACRFSIAIA